MKLPRVRKRGLSPLARGTRSCGLRGITPYRFIPARAGNTCSTWFCRGWMAVYPRSRGEHLANSSGEKPSAGLSPLARGTRRHPKSKATSKRFIPARAGNTQDVLCFAFQQPVYPRSRGEHDQKHTRFQRRFGLSPLARGTHRLLQCLTHSLRFIPARAGNTEYVDLTRS